MKRRIESVEYKMGEDWHSRKIPKEFELAGVSDLILQLLKSANVADTNNVVGVSLSESSAYEVGPVLAENYHKLVRRLPVMKDLYGMGADRLEIWTQMDGAELPYDRVLEILSDWNILMMLIVSYVSDDEIHLGLLSQTADSQFLSTKVYGNELRKLVGSMYITDPQGRPGVVQVGSMERLGLGYYVWSGNRRGLLDRKPIVLIASGSQRPDMMD